MLDTYLTVKTNGSHEIIIQKSRFITHVKRTVDEADAQHFIQSIKKAHYQASHNCSAYLIGDRDQFQKQMMTVSQVALLACRCLKF